MEREEYQMGYRAGEASANKRWDGSTTAMQQLERAMEAAGKCPSYWYQGFRNGFTMKVQELEREERTRV